jgi:DNA segregation ATPase FtsK/SpoIIIE, S-DNA-T family
MSTQHDDVVIRRESSSKKSSSGGNKSNKSKMKTSSRNMKIFSVLLLVFSILIFFSLISYTPKDEVNTEISFGELMDFIGGNSAIQAKIETTRNWLGLFGAIFAKFIFKSTFGYAFLFFPIVLMIWAVELFRKSTIPTIILKYSTTYFVLSIIYSAFMGTWLKVDWLPQLSVEWAGAVGMFLSTISAGLLGGIGSLILCLIVFIVAVFLGTDLKLSYISQHIHVDEYIEKIKSWFEKDESEDDDDEVENEDFESGSDTQPIHEERTYEIHDKEVPLTESPPKEIDLDDEESIEPARMIKRNVEYQINPPKEENFFQPEPEPYFPDEKKTKPAAKQAVPEQPKAPEPRQPLPYELKQEEIRRQQKLEAERIIKQEQEKLERIKEHEAILEKQKEIKAQKPSYDVQKDGIFNVKAVKQEQVAQDQIGQEQINQDQVNHDQIEANDSFENEIIEEIPSNDHEQTGHSEFIDDILNSQPAPVEYDEETVEEINEVSPTSIPTPNLEESINKSIESIEKPDRRDFDGTTVPSSEENAIGAIPHSPEAPKPKLTLTVKEVHEPVIKAPENLLSTSLHDKNISYNAPHFGLLINKDESIEVNDEELKTNARILQDKLETFKIYIENLSVTPGPVVTQYEFVPAPGIKISKIESLADDLAMALKARGIRIIAPIPGKGTVGIEIPNSNPSMVRFSQVVRSAKFMESDKHLPLALGKTISGEVVVTDLAKMPHLLVAGSTGSGKSVGVNTIINSLLYKKKPNELKFAIVDPKKVELQHYKALSNHFLAVCPDIDDLIITNPEEAVILLKSLCKEMDMRYDILAESGQRNIFDYNTKVNQGKIKDTEDMVHRAMPFIVVIIDELADLMLTAGKEVETPITRLAQLARAVGIHLVVATQRPSVDVITGIIKANFPARIAYLVASKVDSRTILDMGGADQLLGNGDMLFLPGGQPKPERVQNSFISTDEVEDICEFIQNQVGYDKPYMLPSLIEKNSAGDTINRDDRDPLFADAARVIITHQQGSVSLLQRRLKIGYARAGRIVDELEAAGIVGPYDGSKARKVYMESEAELEAVL